MDQALTLSPEKYLEGIASGDRDILQRVHANYFERISSFIKSNSGSEEDAKDIFQDAILSIYVKTVKEDLHDLQCSFYTYLFAVCRNLWLKKLRKLGRETTSIAPESEDVDSADILAGIEEKERWDLYREKLNALGNECREILRMFFEKISFREIAGQTNTTEAYAKKKKYLCQKKLIELIKADRRYSEISKG